HPAARAAGERRAAVAIWQRVLVHPRSAPAGHRHHSSGLLRALPETQRAHVRPDLAHVRQALRLASALASIPPTGGIVVIHEHDRVLLLVVDDHSVRSRVFFLVLTHLASIELQRDAFASTALP